MVKSNIYGVPMNFISDLPESFLPESFLPDGFLPDGLFTALIYHYLYCGGV